jgi:hypothetical protein
VGARLPSECGLLQALASVQRVGELEQTHVVLGDVVDEVARGVELTQRQLVVVLVVQDVHEVGVEGVDLFELGELVEYLRYLVVVVLLRVLDLARVELANAADGVLLVDDGGRLALRLGQDDVDKVLGRRHHSHLLEVVVRHAVPCSLA